ncbi:MAG: hypothetical protein HY596_00080, partial [Candidatus Omnitrophica bacterium]|nr:hypothetical protein [Candidatus Omnitrophota bacterium]
MDSTGRAAYNVGNDAGGMTMADKEKDRQQAERQKAQELAYSQNEKQCGTGTSERQAQDTKLDIPALSTGSLALDV